MVGKKYHDSKIYSVLKSKLNIFVNSYQVQLPKGKIYRYSGNQKLNNLSHHPTKAKDRRENGVKFRIKKILRKFKKSHQKRG